MAWTPQIPVIDHAPFVDNLLGFIRDNQTDALEWANGGLGLPDFAGIYPDRTGWAATKYPLTMVLSRSLTGPQDAGNGSITDAGLDLTFETVVMAKRDDLAATANRYDLALRSMLANVTSAILVAGNKTITRAYLLEDPETVYNEAGTKSNSFLQIFRTSVSYGLFT